jgi:hypothetical protein
VQYFLSIVSDSYNSSLMHAVPSVKTHQNLPVQGILCFLPAFIAAGNTQKGGMARTAAVPRFVSFSKKRGETPTWCLKQSKTIDSIADCQKSLLIKQNNLLSWPQCLHLCAKCVLCTMCAQRKKAA